MAVQEQNCGEYTKYVEIHLSGGGGKYVDMYVAMNITT